MSFAIALVALVARAPAARADITMMDHPRSRRDLVLAPSVVARDDDAAGAPVVGSWLALADWGHCSPNNPGCMAPTSGTRWFVANGLASAAGALAILDLLIWPRAHRRKLDTSLHVKPTLNGMAIFPALLSYALCVRIALALILFAACSANDDIPEPVLSSVTPDHTGPGAVVMLSGAYLCQQPEGSADSNPLACENTGSVMFGVEPAVVSQYTDTSVNVTVPDLPAGSVDISVAVAGRTTNSVGFTVD